VFAAVAFFSGDAQAPMQALHVDAFLYFSHFQQKKGQKITE